MARTGGSPSSAASIVAALCRPGPGCLRAALARGRTPATSAELATLILEEAEVAVVPGEAFGPSGYLRLSYALSDEDLMEGVSRLQKLLSEATAAG